MQSFKKRIKQWKVPACVLLVFYREEGEQQESKLRTMRAEQFKKRSEYVNKH